jgi:hypothetical protein
MTLSEFAKQLPAEFTEQEFVDLMNRVIDLKSIVDMPEAERDALFDGAQYLVDFILLVREVKGELNSPQGRPVVAYRGPFVPNALTRPDGVAVDPTALETLGVGEGEKYLDR